MSVHNLASSGRSLDLEEDENGLGHGLDDETLQSLPLTTTWCKKAQGSSLDLAQKKRIRYRWLSLTFVGLIVLGALVATLWPSQDHLSLSLNCGSSPQEAIERGCNFDAMTFCWVLPECDDKDLTEEFMQEHDWEWYAEFNDTKTVSPDIARAGATNVWVNWKFHVTHCRYMWLKMHRAIINQKPIDSHLAAYNHTLHCSKVLEINWIADAEVMTPAEVKYPRCGP